MDGNWRTQITMEGRQKLIKKIMDTLQTHVPEYNQANMNELLKIACRFEEKIYQSASDQQDYFRRITTRLVALERNSIASGDSSTAARQVTATSGGTHQMDPTTGLMQQHLLNQGQSMVSGMSMQTHGQQQALSQPLAGGLVTNILQSSTGLGSSISTTIGGVTQSSLNNTSGQSSLSSLSASQNLLLTSAQRLQQLQQGRQQQQSQTMQQQQQKMQQQLLYHQQHYMLKQNMQPSQQPILQQQQQPLHQQQPQPFLQQQTQPQVLEQMNSVQALQQQQQQQRLRQLQQQSSQQHQVNQQQQQPSQQQQPMFQQETMDQQHHSQPQAPVKSEPTGVNEELDVVAMKLQALKERYFSQLKEIYSIVLAKTQQPLPADQLAKLKHYKELLQRVIPYLTVAKDNMPKELNQARADALEKHIVNILEIFKHTRAPTQQPQSLQEQQHAKQQQQQEQESKPATGDHASPQQQLQQQLINQMQQPDAQTQHPLGLVPGDVVKPNDAVSIQGQVVSTLQKGTGLAGHPVRSNMPHSTGVSDLQMKTPNMLQAVTVNSLHLTSNGMQMQQPFLQNDKTKHSWLLKEQDQPPQQHKFKEQVAMNQLQKSRGSMLQFQGQDVKGELKMKQVEMQQLKQRQFLQQQQAFRVGSPQMVSSPQLLLDNLPLGPQQKPIDINSVTLAATQQNFKAGTPSQASPFIRLPSTSLQSISSPQEVDSRTSKSVFTYAAIPGNAEHPESTVIGSMGLAVPEVSPFRSHNGMLPMTTQPLTMEDGTSISGEPPLQRLISKIDAVSSRALTSAVEDMFATVNCLEILGAPAPGINSKAAGGEDLALATKNRLETFLPNEADKNNKRKICYCDSIPRSSILQDGSLANNLSGSASLESLGFGSWTDSVIRKKTVEVYPALKREIVEINKQLVETYLEIDEIGSEDVAADGKEGLLVSCIYTGMTSNHIGTVCSQSPSWMFLPPLKLVIPPSYPHSSPIFQSESSTYGSHPVASAAREEFVQAARCLPYPVSLEALAKAWDVSARNAVMDIVASVDGGSFSSAFGVWQSCTTS